MKNNPSKVAYSLTGSRLIETSDESGLMNVTINFGIYEKEKDLFRVMRVIRENNNDSIRFKIDEITNPRFISPLDKQLLSKLY